MLEQLAKKVEEFQEKLEHMKIHAQEDTPSSPSPEMGEPKINSVQFAQDFMIFTCSKDDGFTIYSADPLVEMVHFKGDMTGSIAVCELLGRSNLFATVSGGSDPKFPDNVLVIYDDIEKSARLKINFGASIKRVRYRKDRLVVALLNHIYVYSFPMPAKLLFELKTIDNPEGILEVSCDESDKQLMVFPGLKSDTGLRIVDLSVADKGISDKPNWFPAHKNPLGVVALNNQSTMVATASKNGTLIRVWDLATKTQLREIRRGTDSARIYCLNFCPQSEFLCCSSDKGTVHIFAIQEEVLNKRNYVAEALPGTTGYSKANYSCVSFTVSQEVACVCAITTKKKVIALCTDGTYHKYGLSVDSSGKPAITKEAFEVFLDVCDDDSDLID